MRTKRFAVEPDGEGHKKIIAEMEDEYHHLVVRLWIDEQELKIRRIEPSLLRCPEPTCAACEENIQKLVGACLLHPHFRLLLIRTIGGERGCFHILELLHEVHDYTRSFVWDRTPALDGSYSISRLDQKSKVRCIAYCEKKA